MKRTIALMIASLFLLMLISSTGQCANTPFTVYGRFSYDGIYYNSVTVTIWDSTTKESLSYIDYPTLITWTGENGDGYYSGNLGNMLTQWQRGDIVYVNMSFQRTVISGSFTIPAEGYIYNLDVSGSTGSSSGGTGLEGQNQYHSVPTPQDFINWFRTINLGDFFTVLIMGLLVIGAASLLGSARHRPRRKRY